MSNINEQSRVSEDPTAGSVLEFLTKVTPENYKKVEGYSELINGIWHHVSGFETTAESNGETFNIRLELLDVMNEFAAMFGLDKTEESPYRIKVVSNFKGQPVSVNYRFKKETSEHKDSAELYRSLFFSVKAPEEAEVKEFQSQLDISFRNAASKLTPPRQS